jgi:hypothetical protein
MSCNWHRLPPPPECHHPHSSRVTPPSSPHCTCRSAGYRTFSLLSQLFWILALYVMPDGAIGFCSPWSTMTSLTMSSLMPLSSTTLPRSAWRASSSPGSSARSLVSFKTSPWNTTSPHTKSGTRSSNSSSTTARHVRYTSTPCSTTSSRVTPRWVTTVAR